MKSLNIYLVFLIVSLASCSEDAVILQESNPALLEIDNRSVLNPDCKDFIKNGDFEDGIEGAEAFGNGNVQNWDCYYGTADLVGPNFQWTAINWSNYVFQDRWSFH